MDHELAPGAVNAILTTHWVGRPYFFLPAVDSTNSRLRELATGQTGCTAGTVLATDFQAAGRGRLGRRWEAPAGTSLLVSILLQPDWPAEQMTWLTMIAGLAVVRAIAETARLNPFLKWPNDVVIQEGPQWFKVGGILLENLPEPAGPQATILGIGINVNVTGDRLPTADVTPTSLQLASGRTISRLALLASLLRHLEQNYEAADRGRSPQPEWSQKLMTLGQEVTVTDSLGRQTLSGLAEDTDAWGRLLVRDEIGDLHAVAAGDVTLRHR